MRAIHTVAPELEPRRTYRRPTRLCAPVSPSGPLHSVPETAWDEKYQLQRCSSWRAAMASWLSQGRELLESGVGRVRSSVEDSAVLRYASEGASTFLQAASLDSLAADEQRLRGWDQRQQESGEDAFTGYAFDGGRRDSASLDEGEAGLGVGPGAEGPEGEQRQARVPDYVMAIAQAPSAEAARRRRRARFCTAVAAGFVLYLLYLAAFRANATVDG